MIQQNPRQVEGTLPEENRELIGFFVIVAAIFAFSVSYSSSVAAHLPQMIGTR